jgi:TolB-like protein/Flp pilus assembly protein TadD
LSTATIEGANIRRRLAAVVFADVAGFSSLMERDDVRTVTRWKSLRSDLLEPKIVEHHGNLIEVMGDGLFIEFDSAVDAVRWANDVQRAIAQSAGEQEGNELKLRIGINVEDVIIDEGRRHGDGVNIAARIQQLASPGDIVMTSAVRDHIWNKLGVPLADLGEHALRNISRPVRIYRVEQAHAGDLARRFVQPHLTWNNRPSIAVMPFKNLGGDPKEEYFGEGITEDIIGALAHNRSLLVISRHSTLPYRDRHADARQIASELGVRYVLDGSVRRQSAKLRITAELIDASRNSTIWADKFDGAIDELFEFQDRIATSIVATIEPRVYAAEAARVRTKPTESLDAYDCLLRAFPLLYTSDAEEFMSAGAYLDRAIELDPAYAQAHAYKAWWTVLLIGEWRSRATEADFARAIAMARRALSLDPSDAFVLAVAAHVEAFLNRHPESAAEMFERSLQLNKNSAFAWGVSAITCCYLGQPEEALERLRNAWRLSPFDPLLFFFWGVAGFADLLAGRYEQALVWLEKSRRDHPGHLAAHRNLATCYAHLDRLDEARAAAADLLAREPGFRVTEFEARYPLRRREDLDRIAAGLRAAGLPE